MMRKKVAMTLDQRYIMMIDNAYYSVNPPITEARSQVKSSRIIIITDRFLATFFREDIGIIFFVFLDSDSRIIWLHYFFICSPMFHVCKKWQNILNDLIFYLKCFFVFFSTGTKVNPNSRIYWKINIQWFVKPQHWKSAQANQTFALEWWPRRSCICCQNVRISLELQIQ